MILRTLAFLILLSFTSLSHGQNKNFIDVPYLETSATVDTLVVPDRIFFTILMNEKDAKGNMTFDQLQVKMEETLRNLGINTKEDLELNDLASNFKKYFLKAQDILKTKQYTLMVKNATMAGKVIVALEGLGISNVSLEKLENSKEDAIMLVLKAKAIKRSKQYADTMANELNQKAGAAIFISDQNEPGKYPAATGNVRARGYSLYADAQHKDSDIQFEKIKFETTVEVLYKLN